MTSDTKADIADANAPREPSLADINAALPPGHRAVPDFHEALARRVITNARASKLLADADAAINGPRAKDYGTPKENFEAVAAMWNAYLGRRQGGITARDVAQMMILLKAARLSVSPDHRDSLLDQAGYAALAEELQ